ncbi:Thioredoxin chloroplastic [Micractinium conductrix]|uniref:Thioredoxin chloroplastic n=1 Tax=Micractinium conductrix TaxID=554055 RepID=A0A2P6VD13_9CHLO|nr:Thioredoxin chloroplastic [Micractinium conductrix]|eukprot:PSC71986.1 Thioredoxin chloroplastic [Micractinium conductrix]
MAATTISLTASRPVCARAAFGRTARPRLAVRASRDAELAKMAEFKKGLSARLEATTPGVAAAAAEGGAVATEAPAKHLMEVNKDNFYAVVEEKSASKLVLVDCYTDWCGPCKMILPTLLQWSEELADKLEIIKFNCNKENKEVGIALGIKVAPTFLLYKDNKQVAMMTGAKTEQLRELIETHM